MVEYWLFTLLGYFRAAFHASLARQHQELTGGLRQATRSAHTAWGGLHNAGQVP